MRSKILAHPIVLAPSIFGVVVSLMLLSAAFVTRSSIVFVPQEIMTILVWVWVFFLVLFSWFALLSYSHTALDILQEEVVYTHSLFPFIHKQTHIQYAHIVGLSSLKETPLENLFHMGRLTINTQSETLMIKNVANISRVIDDLQWARSAATLRV